MKKFILILLVAMLANSVRASSISTDTPQKVLAKPIVFITSGVQLPGIGTANFAVTNDMTKTKINEVPVTAKVTKNKLNTENSSFTTGIAAIITGEPLFVVSSKHKERAFSVSTTEQVIKKMHRNSISRVSIPSIKLTIHL